MKDGDLYVRESDGKREALRKDSRCLQCLGDRTPKKGISGQTGMLAWRIKQEVAEDPFCSANCARLWHGIAVPETAIQKKAREREEALAA